MYSNFRDFLLFLIFLAVTEAIINDDDKYQLI